MILHLLGSSSINEEISAQNSNKRIWMTCSSMHHYRLYVYIYIYREREREREVVVVVEVVNLNI